MSRAQEFIWQPEDVEIVPPAEPELAALSYRARLAYLLGDRSKYPGGYYPNEVEKGFGADNDAAFDTNWSPEFRDGKSELGGVQSSLEDDSSVDPQQAVSLYAQGSTVQLPNGEDVSFQDWARAGKPGLDDAEWLATTLAPSVASQLDAIMEKHPTKAPAEVHRIVYGDFGKSLQPGSSFTDPGWVSTSKTRAASDETHRVATEEIGATIDPDAPRTRLTVEVPAGVGHIDINGVLGTGQAAADLEHYTTHQEEVLLEGGLTFEVISREGDEVRVRVIPKPKKNTVTLTYHSQALSLGDRSKYPGGYYPNEVAKGFGEQPAKPAAKAYYDPHAAFRDPPMEASEPGAREDEMKQVGRAFAESAGLYEMQVHGELEAEPNVRDSTADQRRDLKKDIVQTTAGRLSKATGLGGAAASEMMRTVIDKWADSSGDHDVRAVKLQALAVEEFGVKGSATDHFLPQREFQSPGDDSFMGSDEHLRAALRAQYDNTQAYFKSQGITHVSVVRGTTEPVKSDALTSHSIARLQPMSSWSTDLEVATNFAQSAAMTHGRPAAVLAARVPVERVFSTCATGAGCLVEAEVVLLGGSMKVKVQRVIKNNDAGLK